MRVFSLPWIFILVENRKYSLNIDSWAWLKDRAEHMGTYILNFAHIKGMFLPLV